MLFLVIEVSAQHWDLSQRELLSTDLKYCTCKVLTCPQDTLYLMPRVGDTVSFSGSEVKYRIRAVSGCAAAEGNYHYLFLKQVK